MDVKLIDMPFYYLNYEGYTHRKEKIEALFNKLNLEYYRIFNDIKLDLRQDRICFGQIKLISTAIEKNKFPFISIDDDMELIKELPEIINIPDGCDFIFLGGSLYNCGGLKPNMYIESFNENFYRVYYMLSLTPCLIPNIKSAKLMMKFLIDSLYKSEFCDVSITMESKETVYLTPKNGPYFYQDNYNESVTRFLWEDIKDSYIGKYL
jgi:hypothetical protein